MEIIKFIEFFIEALLKYLINLIDKGHELFKSLKNYSKNYLLSFLFYNLLKLFLQDFMDFIFILKFTQLLGDLLHCVIDILRNILSVLILRLKWPIYNGLKKFINLRIQLSFLSQIYFPLILYFKRASAILLRTEHILIINI